MRNRLPIDKKYIKKVVEGFIPQNKRAYAVRRLVEILKHVEKMRLMNGLVRHPHSDELVQSVHLGEYWVKQGSQRRKRVRSFPSRRRGAVEKPYLRYLTAMLGQVFYHSTGTKPALSHLDAVHTKFEMFAGYFLKHYGVLDCRGQFRHYLKTRKSLISQPSTI